jgi:hypothetical protein
VRDVLDTGSILHVSNRSSGAHANAEEDPMADHQTDQQVLASIKQLVDEEHSLHSAGALDASAQARLRTVRVELDQCWDLLRQRRALREFGDDPDKAKVRPPQVVENYEQ